MKIERVMAIFVGQGMTKSRYLKIFKSQYLVEFLRYGPNFLHVIIALKGFEITLTPRLKLTSQTLGFKGLSLVL